MQIHSPKQQTALGRLVRLAALAAATAAAATACASSGTASARPSSSVAGSATPSPGGPVTGSATPSATPSGSASVNPGGPASGVSPSPGQQVIHGLGYTSNGDELTVKFYAGICEKYGLDADQSTAGEVKVRIVVTTPAPSGRPCPMVITEQSVSADLGSPLDQRSVIDASTEKPLPQLDAASGVKHYSPGPIKIGG
ncbi:hypothetical protein [Streptacidiphilus albus]|uniref:hypothetical protein n=1 Tax=Streptacidiphilus albus TaxID=105425 RepID=UPI00054C2270|nr:hypothetical protein [Streptacidiphilus albus]